MIKISNKELVRELIGETKEFPKYTSWLVNQANRFSQGTRPKVVGQLSDMIQECPYRSYEEWKEWYLEQKPDAIDKATKIIAKKMGDLREAMDQIDEKLIRDWVEDLVLVKTFFGLRFQEAILKKLAFMMDTNYRLSTPKDESKGVDGFIGETPVSIKPITYKLKPDLIEKIEAKIIFYEKVKDGILIDTSQILGKEKQSKLA